MSIMRTSMLFMFSASLLAIADGAAAQTGTPPKTPATQENGSDGVGRDRRFAPLTVAPPRTSITPDAPERDPFEVSPRLREGSGRASRFGSQEGMRLNQLLRLRAVVRGPGGGIAKIESGKDVIVVRDGDELDVNNIRYTVTVEADGVLLRGAGAPQYKMLVR
jgi:hypothetical protein